MLIIGDLSGIQDYIFDISHEGGGQARRLRARSFFVQILTEAIALRIREAVDWRSDSIIFVGAGKFILFGDELNEEKRIVLHNENKYVQNWLFNMSLGRLKFSLVTSSGSSSVLEEYNKAMDSLRIEKLRSWSQIIISYGHWNIDSLILEPLDDPCSICHRRKQNSQLSEKDEITGDIRKICTQCYRDADIGRRLPRMIWLILHAPHINDDWEVAGLGVTFSANRTIMPQSGDLAIACLGQLEQLPSDWPPDRVIIRRLARHIPLNADGYPLEFGEIAEYAKGNKLLGVLKMDADSLGVAIDSVLKESQSIRELKHFSQELDDFFSILLDSELKLPQWEKIYTIYAGGDDLLAIGPWDILLDYAGHVQYLFNKTFSSRGLSISAGLSLLKPRRPIRNAIEAADQLLILAKTTSSLGNESKNQISTLGQTWKWSEHRMVISAGKKLAELVMTKKIQRAWLHTLLELSELRQGSKGNSQIERFKATARLEYHVSRNYPKINDSDSEKIDFRKWINRIVKDFEGLKNKDAIYLPAIIRYALTATRE